jgi:SAM-dependent methyltransferase
VIPFAVYHPQIRTGQHVSDGRTTMSNPDTAKDGAFTGSLPTVYNTHLVPLIFEPYASDIVSRLAVRPVSSILEVAAGTGAVTRAMAAELRDGVSIVATDLNQAMIDCASSVGTSRPVEWRQANAMDLPFPDASFDAVVCQFGAMFFPDKPKAFAEARRVLKPGGFYLFNVWDKLRENEFAELVTLALEQMFPEDPPRFLARTPYGYSERSDIERDLAQGGFTGTVEIASVPARSVAPSAHVAALAYVEGTPLRNEIEARDAARMREAVDAAAVAISRRFGPEAVDGRIQAHVVTAER